MARRSVASACAAGAPRAHNDLAMIRTVFTEAALFLTPFVVYAMYLWATRAGVIDPEAWTPKALTWLTMAALAAVIVGFVAIAEFSGARPGSTYIPAHIEDGRVVPGRTK